MTVSVSIVLTWEAAMWIAPSIHVGPVLHQLALFGHLAALVIGFGAVLTIDWFGLLLITNRRSIDTVLHTAHSAQGLVWLGLIGLLITGLLLEPDTSSRVVMVKLVAVLTVALNGVYIAAVVDRLVAYGTDSPPWSLWFRGGMSLMISQIGWWTATVIGYINTVKRS
jgi:hypothetical protein